MHRRLTAQYSVTCVGLLVPDWYSIVLHCLYLRFYIACEFKLKIRYSVNFNLREENQ